MTDMSGLHISREDIRAYVVATLPTKRLSDWDIDGIAAGVAARLPEILGHHDDADIRDAQAWLDAHIDLGVYFQIVADYQLCPDTNVRANTSDRIAALIRKIADEHPTATVEELAHLAAQRVPEEELTDFLATALAGPEITKFQRLQRLMLEHGCQTVADIPEEALREAFGEEGGSG